MSSCTGERWRFGGLLVLAAVVATVWALPVGTASADPATPYLDHIAGVLNQRSPGTQGKVWWLSKGNVIPQTTATSPGWLLQTVDCWGKPACGEQPPPGGKDFLKKMTQMIAFAKKSVDITELIQFAPFDVKSHPDGGFLDAIVNGLKRGHREHPNQVPVVRFLVGVHPPAVADEQAFVSALVRRVGRWVKVQSGGMKTAAYSWTHAKVVDIDGREAIVGGENYWASDYLSTSHPTNDVSMWLQGPAAADVSRFMNVLWKYTCDNRFIPLNGVAVRYHNIPGFPFANCINDIPTDPAPADPNGRTVMVVGDLGHGIAVPGEPYDKQAAPIVRPNPKLSGNTCNAIQEREDNKDVNNKRDYEYRNPGRSALRALIASARSSIFISQQDLLSCIPFRWAATEAKFDERVFAALADKVVARIPIKIVLSNFSNKLGGYSNGWQIGDVAEVFMQVLEKNHGLSPAAARQALCQDVGLAGLRNDASRSTWNDGTVFYNHAKLVAVDDQAFYIGSGNLYPGGLQELGVIVDDRQAGAHLKQAYLDPMWANSRAGALIDPQANRCEVSTGGGGSNLLIRSRSRTFVLPARSTKTFAVRYPTLKLKSVRHYCQVQASGPGRRYVKILSRRSTRGGAEGPDVQLLPGRTVCRVKVRNTAKRRRPGTNAKIKLLAVTA